MTTDPTTQRMMDETGHSCPACPSDVRNLSATAHNFLGAFDDALAGHADWARARRKADSLRSALKAQRAHTDEHFAALDAWRRP